MEHRISRTEFDKLFTDLKEFLKKKWMESKLPLPHTLSEEDVDILGIGKRAQQPGYLSIQSLLQQSHANGNVNYIYNLLRDFANSDASWISVKTTNLEPFLQLVGYDTIDSLKIACSKETNKVAYRCLFYSLTRFEIKEFQLCLIKQQDGKIKAIVKGFHDAAPELELYGSAYSIDKLLILRTSNDNYYLDLTIHSTHRADRELGQLPVSNVLQGFVNTNSSYDFPLSLECVLLKESFCNDIELINASRYLFLKRSYNRIKVPVEKKDDTTRLQVNHANVNKIAHMAGKSYRIWTYSVDKKSVLQSKLTIEINYKAIIHTPTQGTLNCLITINNADNLRLLISAYKQTHLTTFTILPILPPNSLNELPVVRGAFCTVGELNHNPAANYFVMMEEEHPNDLLASIIKGSDIPGLCKKYPTLKKLKAALDKLIPFE